MDKGTVSNLISATVLGCSFLIPEDGPHALVLSAAMFALSSGVTNTLAVKMLFDRVPGLIGSGVIPTRFREIREQIKRLIMEHFFSEAYLHEFFAKNAKDFDWAQYIRGADGEGNLVRTVLERKWDDFVSPDTMRPAVRSNVDRLMDSSIGGLLHVVGRRTVEDIVTGLVDSFLVDVKELVLEQSGRLTVTTESLGIEIDEDSAIVDLRQQVGVLLEEKLQQLDAQQVKKMMEDVIRQHLGWLVVWGNVFGGLLGLVAYAVR